MQGIVGKWIPDNNGLYEYYIENNGVRSNYDVAKSACESFEATLASIKSNSTQNLIEKLLPPLLPGSGTRQFWIGAHRTSQNSSWIWDDGAPLNYSNWDTMEDVQSNEVPENCGSLFSGFKYKWFSSHCESNQFGYICERLVGELPATTPLQTNATRAIVNSNVQNAVENETNAVLQVALPILAVFIFLLLLIGVLYSCKKKQRHSFCNCCAPMTPSQRTSKKVLNEYVDLPPGTSSSNSSTPVEQSPASRGHGRSFEIQLLDLTDKERTKSSLDNPTYVQIEIPQTPSSEERHGYTELRETQKAQIPQPSSAPDIKDYAVLHSINTTRTQTRHGSDPTFSHSQYQQNASGVTSTGTRKFHRGIQSSKSPRSKTDAYVDVYSLSTKMKPKK